eukprot:5919370-Ditylum_brightwellii.AAC.1
MQHASSASQLLCQSKNKVNNGLMWHDQRASQPLIQYEEVTDGLVRHDYKETEGDDGLMWHTHGASQPLIQYEVVEDGLMRYDCNGNKEDDGLMWHTHRASQPLI